MATWLWIKGKTKSADKLVSIANVEYPHIDLLLKIRNNNNLAFYQCSSISDLSQCFGSIS